MNGGSEGGRDSRAHTFLSISARCPNPTVRACTKPFHGPQKMLCVDSFLLLRCGHEALRRRLLSASGFRTFRTIQIPEPAGREGKRDRVGPTCPGD